MTKSMYRIVSVVVALAWVSGPALAAGGDAAAGKKIFATKCAVCHSIVAGENKMGPSLAGIFGKKAGTSSFKKYNGLKNSDIVWNVENLHKLLKDPKAFLGKTGMYGKVRREKKRSDIIEYLKTLK